MATRREQNWNGVIALSAIAMVGGMTWAGSLSSRFEYGTPMLERPHVLLVAILMGCGAAYVAAAYALQRIVRVGPGLFIAILLVGILMRASMFVADPIQEDDFYRYLWDGALVANGHNPYPVVPEALGEDEALASLAMDSKGVHGRINHADLATIYPPVAQGAFAVAYFIRPWSLDAWRAVLLVFDAATMLLVVIALRSLGRPLHWAALYWWNDRRPSTTTRAPECSPSH